MSAIDRIKWDQFLVQPGKKVKLSRDFDPNYTGDIDKDDARERLNNGVAEMARLEDRFYADDRFALVLIFQAMDAAGKDGTIKHVMSGLNPQGCRVSTFKAPTHRELNHDFLWRCNADLPERGQIGIFNRSYYEEVLVVRVHPELLAGQHLPEESIAKGLWKRRFEQINNYENYLVNNGVHIMKFFLNVSKDEQKKRFLARIELPEKNWKLSPSDAAERKYWNEYQDAYEDMLEHTSTPEAPWHVIPADHKWFTHLSVAALIVSKLQEINPTYPVLSEEQMAGLQEVKAQLEAEK